MARTVAPWRRATFQLNMTTSEVDTTVGQENGGTGYKTTMPGVTTGILLLRPENDSVEYELEVLVIKKTLKRRP